MSGVGCGSLAGGSSTVSVAAAAMVAIGVTADGVAAAATLLTAGVALAAALFARGQVIELRKAREEEARPFVVVDIQPSSVWNQALNLVIENVGKTVAKDVRFDFDPGLESAVDSVDLSESVLVKRGIPMLPPGRRLQAFFDTSVKRKDSGLPMTYEVTVRLCDAHGREQEPQHYILDLTHLYGLSQLTEYGIHDAAKALREIQKSVKRWSDIHGRLKVWVRDEDRKLEDERIQRDLTGRGPYLGSAPPPEWLMKAGRSLSVRAVARLARRLRHRAKSAA